MRLLIPLLLLACVSCSDKYIRNEYDVPQLEGDVEALRRSSNQCVPIAVYARPDSDRAEAFVNAAVALLEASGKWTVVSRPGIYGSPITEAICLARAREARAKYVLFVRSALTEDGEEIRTSLTVEIMAPEGGHVATIRANGKHSPHAGAPTPGPITLRALSMLGPEPVTGRTCTR